MVVYTLAFLTGVCLFQYQSVLPPLWCLAAIGFVAVILYFFRLSRLIAVLITGFLWSGIYATIILSDPIDADLLNRKVIVSGHISEIPKTYENGDIRFVFRLQAYRAGKQWILANQQVLLYWRKPQAELTAGDNWQFQVKLKAAHGYANPGGFDRERWLFLRGIQATGSVKLSQHTLRQKAVQDMDINRWRESIATALTVSSDLDNVGLLRALAVGDKQSITHDQWTLLRETGTAHLVAISGLHVGIVSGLVILVVRVLWASSGLALAWPAKKTAAVVGIIMSILYAILAGFDLPVQRALIMLNTWLLAILLNRDISPWRLLAIAMIAVLLLDPRGVLSPGFWLSFSAVGCIFYLLSGRLNPGHKMIVSLKIQLLLAMGLLPVMIPVFHQITVIAPLANLIAVPLVTLLIVPLILLAIIFLVPFATAAHGLIDVADHLLSLLVHWLEIVNTIGPGIIEHVPMNNFFMPLLALAVVLLLLPRGLVIRYAGLMLIITLPFSAPDRPARGDVWMSVLDIGQGLAVVVQTQTHTLLYDTGPAYPSGHNTAETVILPFLATAGIDYLDRFIISHSDNDHAGGAAMIVDQINTGQILTGEPEALLPISTRACLSGQHWQWDGVSFDMLSPDVSVAGNNGSCVLRITDSSGKKILLTGDIEKPVEHHLIRQQAEQLQANILLVPHHGSKTSSSPGFINTVMPGIAIVPAGFMNRFHFPKDKIMSRYQNRGITLYITGEDGAVFVRSTVDAETDLDGFNVTTYRQQVPRYWQQ
ncbi:MAG: DNA internalization-related competence protein ComEC/Rec2 [Gammaproteobacteria bacterium]